MARLVCARCGREADRLIRGLCPSCFAEVYGVARIPGVLRGEVCRYCGSVRIAGRWVPAGSFEAAIDAVVRWQASKARPVEPLVEARLASWEALSKPDWRTRVALNLEGRTAEGVVVRARVPVVVQLKPSICPTCKTRVSGEYDTVLQLRGGDPGALERLAVEALTEAGVEGDTVDLIKSKDGVDVYFTHRGAASRLVRILKRRGLVETVGRAEEYVGLTSTGRRTRKTLIVRVRL
ncbi:NMD3-related protein [Stetteria hydrogenophila]